MNKKQMGLFWLLGLIWGTSFLWIKIAVQEISPVILVGFRTLFGALGVGMIILVSRSDEFQWKKVKKNIFPYILLGIFNIAIPWLLISWAEQHIDSGIAAVLNGTMPLFTIIISPIFVKDDPVTLPKVFGLGIGFMGVVILLSPTIHEGFTNNVLGQIAMLAASLSYAASAVFAKKNSGDLYPKTRTMLQLGIGSLFLWIFALLFGQPVSIPRMPLTWIALLWLGLLGSCVAYIIYFYLLPRIGPTRMSMVTYIPPLVAVILGVVLLHENFYWQSIIGSILILSGIMIVNIKGKSLKKA